MTERPRSWLSRHGGKLALSLVIGAGFALLLRAGALPLVPDPASFARVEWWTLPAYVGVWAVVHTLRAARWHYLLAPIKHVPLGRIVSASFIGFAAIVVLPLRTGEVVRPVLLRREGVSAWAATGTVAAERVIDGLFLTTLLFVALAASTPLDPLPDRIGDLAVPVAVVPRAAYAMLAVFAAAFVAMGVFYWRREFARRATERVVGLVSPRLATWLSDKVEQVASGLGFLPRWRYSAPFLGWTALYWAANICGIWLLAWGAGLDAIGPVQACVIMGVIALGILVPNAPGFFGAFQVSVYAALAMFCPKEDVIGPGAALTFLLYGTQVSTTLLAALGAMLVDRHTAGRAVADSSKELGAADGRAS